MAYLTPNTKGTYQGAARLGGVGQHMLPIVGGMSAFRQARVAPNVMRDGLQNQQAGFANKLAPSALSIPNAQAPIAQRLLTGGVTPNLAQPAMAPPGAAQPGVTGGVPPQLAMALNNLLQPQAANQLPPGLAAFRPGVGLPGLSRFSGRSY